MQNKTVPFKFFRFTSYSRDKLECLRATLVICLFVTSATLALAFRLELFPFSFYPMYSGIKPMAGPPLEDLADVDPQNMSSKEDALLIFGIKKDGSKIYLPYRKYFYPFFRDQFWWSHVRNKNSNVTINQMLKDLYGFSRLKLLKQDISGIGLYQVVLPLRPWLDVASTQSNRPLRNLRKVAEYLETEIPK